MSLFCNALLSFAIIWTRKREISVFTLIVYLMSSDCKYSVALPHVAMGWSVVYDLGVS